VTFGKKPSLLAAVAIGASLSIVIIVIILLGNIAKTSIFLPGRTDNETGSDKLVALSPNDCQKRVFIPTPGGKLHSCGGISTRYASITGFTGFPACIQMYDSDPSSLTPATYDLVLAPNSTGYITIVYDFGSNDLPPKDYFANVIKSDIHRLTDDGNGLEYLPANQTSISAFVDLENVTYTGAKTVKLTYTVETKATKPEEVGHTYYFGVFEACGGEFVTIGAKPYSGRLPLD
jgi:hypothetical protein